MRWPESKASTSPIDVRTKAKEFVKVELVEAVKRALKKVYYMTWVNGGD
jgi:hypothetical protein